MSYSTSTHSGVTDIAGSFNYEAGETVTFSLGDLVLPAVAAKDIVTPVDVFANDIYSDSAVVNLSRLLQTLDVDGNSDNGITIASVAAASAAMVDFAGSAFDENVINLVANSGSVTTTLVDDIVAIAHLNSTLQSSGLPQFSLPQDGQPIVTDATCGSTHSLVGSSAEFTTFFHEVTGRATIVDDCTIEVTEFGYDGLGPKVYFYGALDGRYGSEEAFIIGGRLDGRSYTNDAITLTLPTGMSLDDLNGLSVWCADFDVDFGSAEFTAKTASP